MRLMRTRDGRTGLVVGPDNDRVIDLAGSLGALERRAPRAARVVSDALLAYRHQGWGDMIDGWDDVGPALATLVEEAERDADALAIQPLAAVELGPPLTAIDSRVFAVGANFAPHAAQSDAAIAGTADAEAREAAIVRAKREGLPPWGFSFLPGTFVGSGADITPPPGTQKLDYEAEVAVVFRATGSRRGRDVQPWGITALNDLSIRDPHLGLGVKVDHGPMTWTLQKNFDTSNACGPWVVVDEGLDAADLDFSMRVNGDLRQSGNTSEMVYSFDDVVDHISAYLSMRSGDVIVSGTCAGTALEQGADGPYLQDGDEMVVEVEGVGTLRNRVMMALPRARREGSK
jgi:2-keto-4-pentenoate hydratase/2-oxohepta-3-ene-1,7-dioic acid hydratase in catechol pathway